MSLFFQALDAANSLYKTANSLYQAFTRTPEVDISQPVHPLSNLFGTIVRGSMEFRNSSGQIGHLRREHFQEGRYQSEVEIPLGKAAAVVTAVAAVAAVVSGVRKMGSDVRTPPQEQVNLDAVEDTDSDDEDYVPSEDGYDSAEDYGLSDEVSDA